MRKIFMLLLALICFAMVHAQSRMVRGKVTDQNNQPVEGASVVVKGTKRGTSADAQGNFSIAAVPGEVLQFSSVNFSPAEITVGDQSTLSVMLTRTEGQINEVVVTALGIRRSKNQLPYAAQQIGGDEVTKTRSNNVIGSMSGKIAGLEVRQTNTLGGSTNIVLRGYKSFTQSNQALFVVDGMPFDNANTNTDNQTLGRGGYDYGSAAADINPDDIESITVLKGAAATALYGSRAANGVILITTKKGRKGLGISVNSGVTIGKADKATFPKYQNQYGAGYGSANEYGSPDGNFLYFDVDGDGQPDLVTPMGQDASWGAKFDPNLQVYQWDAFFDKTSPYYGKPRPWVAAAHTPYSFLETAVSLNNSVFLEGGDDKAGFTLGYTKTNDKGILPNSKINKDLLNFSASYKVTKDLTAAASVNFSKIDGLGRYGTGYDPKNPMTNFREWWENNVDILEQKDAYFRTRQNITWNWLDPSDPVNGKRPAYWDNQYWNRYENYENDQRYRYFGNVSLNYKITDWLNVLGRVSLDSYDEMQEERIAVGSTPALIAGQSTQETVGEPSGYAKYNHSFREYNYDLLVNFDKNISKDLNVKALLGGNIRRTQDASNLAKTNGGIVIPHFYALSNSVNPLSPPIETQSLLEVDGIFAGATLSYKEMLVLDATLRRDRASSLPESNNTYYYPSVSGGFVFSKLLPNLKWINYGKLRANYAEVGNNAPALSVINTYSIPSPFGTHTLASVANTRNNANLKPELSKSYEVGLEGSLFNNRLGFDVSYYNTKSVDQILPVQVSAATGYNYEYVNAGSIRNQGIEVSLNAMPVKTKDFSWSVNVNWSRNRNKVLSLFDTSNNLLISSSQSDVTVNATLGQPYGTLRGYNFVYKNGQPVVDADGYYLFSDKANEIIGNTNPNWIGGITNTFRYKDLSLSFLIDVRQGGDIWSLDMYYGLATGLYPETAGLNDQGKPVRDPIAQGGGIINPGVTEDGKQNTKRIDISDFFGAYGYFYKPSAAFVYDASYVKLRELALTYSLPKSLLGSKSPFKGIDISLIGRNLWIIHKNLPYADPEEITSSGNGQGVQGGAYPTTRTMGVNLKLRF